MTDFLPSSALLNYDRFLSDLKEQIRSAQVRASIAINRELILLYWEIGRSILEQQRKEGWGTRVIEQLGKDLAKAFPEMRGLSSQNPIEPGTVY